MNIQLLRNILFSHFNDDELVTFCMDHYPNVYHNFTLGMTKNQKIQLLLENCKKSLHVLIEQISKDKPHLSSQLLNLQETTCEEISSFEPKYEKTHGTSQKHGLFRGINLGHTIDPLRSTLKIMEPDLFEKICKEILSVFKFEIAQQEPLTKSLLSQETNIGRGIILRGVFFETFTYAQQIFTEFGVGIDKQVSELLGKDTYYNEGGVVEQMHGPACVIIHSHANSIPTRKDVIEFGKTILNDPIKNVICFTNQSIWNSSFFGIMNSQLFELGLNAAILCLEDIPYQVLTTSIYHKYKAHIQWKFQSHLS